MTLFYMADGHISMGNPLQAKILLEEALTLMCSDDLPQSNYVTSIIAHCQSLLGSALMALGEYDQARLNLQYQPGYPQSNWDTLWVHSTTHGSW